MTVADVEHVLDILSYPGTILLVLSFLGGIWLWARGIAPAIYRLGNGLARRKIAVFAKGGEAASLESLIRDSGLFRKSNVILVTVDGDIGKAEAASVFLVHWPDFSGAVDRIFRAKHDKTALIVYAPPGSVDQAAMAKLNSERNVTLCNFRGRLLNDLVVSMITTSASKG